MAWDYGSGSGDYVSMADHAALTFPDGDWTLSGWYNLAYGNTGASRKYLTSWNPISTNNSINTSILEQSHSTNPSDWYFEQQDGDGTFGNVFSTDTTEPGDRTGWVHWAVVRNHTAQTIHFYINGSQINSNSWSNTVDVINHSGAYYLGAYTTTGAGINWEGYLAEFAKWDRLLTTSEIAALGARYAPRFFTNQLKWYVPMIRQYDEWINGIAITNSGTTAAPHPPMIYPAPVYVPYFTPAAIGGLSWKLAGSRPSLVSYSGLAG